MSDHIDDYRLAVVVNSIVDIAGDVITSGAETAYAEDNMDQLIAAYMSVLLLKHNMEVLIDKSVKDPMQFKFDCLDSLMGGLSEE